MYQQVAAGGYANPMPGMTVMQAAPMPVHQAQMPVHQAQMPMHQAQMPAQQPQMYGAPMVQGMPNMVQGGFQTHQQDDPLAYYNQYKYNNGPKNRYKAVVKASDVRDEAIVQDVIDMAADALDKFGLEKDMAKYIKYEMDRKYDPTWHVIVGKSFGSYIAHEKGSFTHFYIGPLAFMVFKLR